MISKKNKRHPKQYFKNRRCFWCKNSVQECDQETCECVYCSFDDKLDQVGLEYPNYVTWVKNNVKFYNILFNEGILLENELRNKWKKQQLVMIEKSGSTMKDWYADIEEIDGKNRLIPNFSEDRNILQLFYIYKNKDKPLNRKYHCQLCGADINDQYYLKHKTKKVCVPIGHECATAFHFSDEIIGSIRHHMAYLVRNEFRKKKPLMKKGITKLLESNHVEKKTLKSFLNIVKNFGRKNKTPPPAEKLAEIFIKLEEFGIWLFK